MFKPAEPEKFIKCAPPASVQEQEPSSAWQKLLAQSFRDLPSLLSHLELGLDRLQEALGEQGAKLITSINNTAFALRVPRPFADRIQKNDPFDPLLRQVLPTPAEETTQNGFIQDPLAEANSIKGKGLLQKYHGRLLVVAHGSCAVHCRYCFRRHFPYDEQHLPPQHWHQLSDHLNADPTLNEIILSGGDPLTLKNQQLDYLTPILKSHKQVKRLRIHTRFPVMIPQRIDEGLLAWIIELTTPVVLVLHINHANEIDAHLATALARLRQTGATLLNQSVLLRGVNDSAHVQQMLQERLFEVGVLPYYLHLLDPVAGASHFEVPLPQARKIMSELQSLLPGYLVPKLVREEAGKAAKTLISI